ncbi:MAG: TolC family protein [Acidobacteria bacterium]|nr:TolC family protein [Acidobacteriota bacterium]
MRGKRPGVASILLLLLAILEVTGQAQEAAAERGLSLEECWQRARESHPLLGAARKRVEGAEQLRRFAGVRPNPTLTYQSENWRVWGRPPFNFSQDIDLFLFATQRIETAGKAGYRRQLAEKTLATAQVEVDLVRKKLWQDITQRYWRALQLQSELMIGNENRRDLDHLVNQTTIRFREGVAPEWEVIRVRLEEQTQHNQLLISEQELTRAKLELLQAMGEKDFKTDFRLIEPALLNSPLVGQSVEVLQREAEEQRVELVLLRSQVETSRASLRLEQARAKPDVELSAGLKRTIGFNTFIAYLTIELPFFDRNRGEIGRAAAEISSVEQELLAQVNFVRAEVEAGHRAVRQLESRLREMKQEFISRADLSRDIALTAYREGAADLYKVLEAQRARNEARRLYYRTQLDLQMALAELALAVGRSELR